MNKLNIPSKIVEKVKKENIKNIEKKRYFRPKNYILYVLILLIIVIIFTVPLNLKNIFILILLSIYTIFMLFQVEKFKIIINNKKFIQNGKEVDLTKITKITIKRYGLVGKTIEPVLCLLDENKLENRIRILNIYRHTKMIKLISLISKVEVGFED